MEIVIAMIAGLMAIVSPVGAIVDQLAEDAIHGQIAGADELVVRLDNAPNYQIINGRVDHVRLAGRGVYPIPELRIATIDLETDVLDVDVASLQRGELVLDEPAQAALRLVLTAADLNDFLQTDVVQAILDDLRFTLPGQLGGRTANRYGLTDPSLEFLDGDRLRLLVTLQDEVAQQAIVITVELGLGIVNGSQLQLIDPVISVDGETVPPQLLEGLVTGAQRQLDLRNLEDMGITARVLNFEIRNNEFDLAVFARVEPSSPLLGP